MGAGSVKDIETWGSRVIPAVPVPFCDRSTIDLQQLAAYAAWMAEQRVPAVAVGVHTGRGLHLTPQQRQVVVDTWRQSGIDLVLGVGASADVTLPMERSACVDAVIRATVSMTEWAKREGAVAVLVYPPAPFRRTAESQDRAVALHKAVAAVGVPTIAFYLHDAAGGMAYANESVERMLAIDGVVGIKLATLDDPQRFHEVASLAHAHRRLCITGEDLFFGKSLEMGADAALIGMAAACTDCMVDLADAHAGDNRARYEELTRAMDQFAAVTFAEPVDGYVQRMLWALEADGVLEEGMLDPFGPSLHKDERLRVHEAVANLRRS